nr:MAG TPA: D(4) dopamine receptor,Soluble cytochrome b562, dopamine receptor, antagonist, sodium [Caudoviricetes sp.]
MLSPWVYFSRKSQFSKTIKNKFRPSCPNPDNPH